ncbi:MAG: hypothetical protein IKT84_03525 [Bacteroidales bacterium]|nr:hypothetical protein [Bacteroidales bacterium]
MNQTDLALSVAKIATINNNKAKMAVDTISLGYNTYKMYDATMLKNTCIHTLRELDLQYQMYGYLTLEQLHLYNFCLNKKNELTTEQWLRGFGIFVDLCSLSAELANNNSNANNELPGCQK